MSRLRLGTRGSALALWQARYVSSRLEELLPGLCVEQIVIKTEGDGHTKILGADSNRGVFVREIEEALSAGRIDLAVHSLKDLPTEQPEGLRLAAVPPRHDPRDVLLTAEGRTLEQLESGSMVATGSFRRRCQILNARPDLELVPVRGNVGTRIRKLAEGRFDALVLALAGLERLGLDQMPYGPLPEEICLPAVGQGALGLQIRSGDTETEEAVTRLNHGPSWAAVTSERSFLGRIGGGCLAPATAYARIEDGSGLLVRAVVGDPDGGRMIRDELVADPAEPEEAGEILAARMLEKGAGEILASIRRTDG